MTHNMRGQMSDSSCLKIRVGLVELFTHLCLRQHGIHHPPCIHKQTVTRSSVEHQTENEDRQHLCQILTVEGQGIRPKYVGSILGTWVVVTDVAVVVSCSGSNSSELCATPYHVKKIIVASWTQEKGSIKFID